MSIIGIIFTIFFIIMIVFIIITNLCHLGGSIMVLKKQIKNVVKNIQNFEDENFGNNKDSDKKQYNQEEVIAEYEEHIKCEYCGSSFNKNLKNCPNCGASINDNKSIK